MDWPIERKIQWGLGIAVTVLCGLGLIAYALILSFVNTDDWLIHTHLVIEAIQSARTALDDAETSVRGYLLTRDQSYLGPYNLIQGRVPGLIERLRTLSVDNSAQRQMMAQLDRQVSREMDLLHRAVEAAGAHSKPFADQRNFLDEDQNAMSSIRNILGNARLQENQLLSVRDAAWRRDLTEAISAAAILGLLNFVLLGSIYYAFKKDLFERRRAEAAHQASEERLRLMVASVKDYAFFMLNPQGRVATWNEGAAIIKGYETEEIVGQHFSKFFTEEDRKAGKPEWALDQAAKKGRLEIEGMRVRKDGSQFWANAITSAIRDERGRLLGFSEVARDLTERKLAEEKIRQSQSSLAAILDGSPSVIFVKDPEGRYTLVNRRFEDSFSLNREQVLGKTDAHLFPGETAQKLREHDIEAIEAGRALEFEEVIPQKDGSHTYISARVPLLDDDKRPYALCGVSTDITERKASEQEIQRLNRSLQDRVIDHSVQLMQTADELKMEREQRLGAEEREQQVRDRLRELMLRSSYPMWTYDLETLALLEVNDAALTLHGLSREGIPQVRMKDLFPPEDVSRLGKEVQSASAPAESTKVRHHRVKEGRLFPLVILARRVEWQGRDAALVVVVNENANDRVRDINKALEAAAGSGA